MSKSIEEKNKPIQEKSEIKKLVSYFCVVNEGVGDAISRIMQQCGANFSYIENGRGTASKEVLDILGITENKKNIVICLIREDYIEDLKKEICAFFASSKRNRGIGFSIKLDSLIGVRLYKFLTNTI